LRGKGFYTSSVAVAAVRLRDSSGIAALEATGSEEVKADPAILWLIPIGIVFAIWFFGGITGGCLYLLDLIEVW
jgi:hypothetical protein